MKLKKLVIIGSGDLGKLIAHHAIADNKYSVVGFFDDYREIDEVVNGIKILGSVSSIEQLYNNNIFDEILIGVGYKHLLFREQLFTTLNNKIPFGTLVHSSCYVDPSSSIGKGTCLLPGSVLGMNVNISNNVLINIGCSIAHDTSVGDHTFLSPSVALAGFIKIGKRCNIGINTTIIDNIVIKDDIQTGGGTLVIQDLNEKGLYVGCPSRFIR